ncbi:MAG: leucine-rich repeat domain-containing protein [Clostridia bacterium]|nr:leucine-rich repeat domain-containing protein [Clostridia bacterium]
MYSSTMVINYKNRYNIPGGEYYLYSLDEGFDLPQYSQDKIAISRFDDTTVSLSSVFVGMLRSASEVDFLVTDDDTNDAIYHGIMDGATKSFYYTSSAQVIPLQPYLNLSAMDLNLFNNQRLTLTLKAKGDFSSGSNNAKDQISFPIYIDFEKPQLDSCKIREENGRVYIDLVLYDNHYLQDVQLMTGDATNPKLISQYAVPIYDEERGGYTNTTIDITKYVNNIIDNKLVLAIEDYAFNKSIVEIDMLGDKKDEGTDALIKNNGIKTDSVQENEWTTSNEEDFVISMAGVLTEYKGTADIVILPNNVLSIADSVFEDNTIIKKVVFNEGCTLIGQYCFLNCINLEQVELSSTIVFDYVASRDCFEGCMSLKEVDLSMTKGTTVAAYMFMNCTSLERVKLNTEISLIYNHAFSGCSNLTEINMEDTKLTAVGRAAFYSCGSLQSIAFPETFVDIESMAFKGAGIKTITLLRKDSLPNIATYQTETTFSNADAVVYVSKELKELTEAHEKWGWFHKIYAIEDMYEITDKTLTKYIGQNEQIVMPKIINVIGDGAFANTPVKIVQYYSSISSIGQSAFEGSKLESFVLGVDVVNIGDYAFRNCAELKQISVSSSIPATIGSSVFDGVAEDFKILVPLGTDDLFRAAWTEYADLIMFQEFVIQDGILMSYRGTSPYIVVPDGVTGISKQAFAGNKSLISVELPDSVVYLDALSFSECSSLQFIHFGESLSILPESVLYNATALTEVELGANLKEVRTQAFYGTSSLSSVELPEGLEQIGNSAFVNSGIQSITIPASVYKMESYAFGACFNLKYVEIKADIDIMDLLFRNSRNIEQFIFRGDINNMNYEDLYDLPELQTVEFYGDVNYIGKQYFSMCNKLTSVVFYGNVGTIGAWAFTNNPSLSSMVFYGDLDCLKDSATNMCPNLKYFTVAEGNEYLESDENHVLYNKGKTTLKRQPAHFDYEGVYYMPESVTSVEQYAFSYGNQYLASVEHHDTFFAILYIERADHVQDKLTDIVLSKRLIYVADHAFKGNDNLISVLIPYGSALKGIGKAAFANNKSLEYINLRSGVEMIGESAFAYTALRELELPDTINEIGARAFEGSSIEKIEMPRGVKNISSYLFANTTRLTSVIMHDGIESIGDYAFYESKIKVIQFGLNVRSIGAYAFANTDIENVELPEGLQYIEAGAFSNTKLREIRFFDKLVYVGEKSFENAYMLSKVFNTPKEIHVEAFAGCSSLSYIEWGNTKEIYSFAFKDCTSLAKLDLNEGFYELGAYSFINCTALQEINIPSSMSTQNFTTAFKGCTLLSRININPLSDSFVYVDDVLFSNDMTMLLRYPVGKGDTVYVVPEGVTYIAYEAFMNNKSLTRVVLPQSLNTIGVRAFFGTDNLREYVFKSTKAPNLLAEYCADRSDWYENFIMSVEDIGEARRLTIFTPEGSDYSGIVWKKYFVFGGNL